VSSTAAAWIRAAAAWIRAAAAWIRARARFSGTVLQAILRTATASRPPR